MSYLLVFVGGGLGCVARYGMATLVARYHVGSYPIATFLSNVLSCVILAGVLALLVSENSTAKWVKPLLVIGFCGGFSTFSTFSFETVHLIKNGNLLVAAANVILSLAVCFAIAYRIAK
jgi:CrcB protein